VKGESYELALSLADNNTDLLEELHDIITDNGITEETYARAFALLHYKDKDGDERISYAEAEQEWKRSGHVLSDVKLFTALNQSCELVRNYILASWENCVFSTWVSRKEVQKAEAKMDTMESLTHAKAIITLASAYMPSTDQDIRIDWTTEDEEPEITDLS